MTHSPSDTIVALASAPGPGGRAVVRLSGPAAFAAADRVFTADPPAPPRRGRLQTGRLRLTGVSAPLPADILAWPAPHSYTGQDVAEFHTVACPPLIDALVADLLAAGARAAGPGEFTLRAFLAGKLDLPRAEAVHGVVAAADRDQLRDALAQLAGGVTRPLDGLRSDLLDLLADVEAGLDFADEDLEFAGRDDQLRRVAAALARLTHVRKQLDGRSVAGRPFRVALVGRPNAGKSSLFNALAGRPLALVSGRPGTTRDYLTARLTFDGVEVELSDTAGTADDADAVGSQAQLLARRQAADADLLLACAPAGEPPPATDPGRDAVHVATKCDAGPASAGLPTSAATGAGLVELTREVARRARARLEPPLAPSLGRCRHHLDGGLDALRRAHDAVLESLPPEILAAELRDALDHLGAMVGTVYTDDLLDRVFSRFCIGK